MVTVCINNIVYLDTLFFFVVNYCNIALSLITLEQLFRWQYAGGTGLEKKSAPVKKY